jgi:FkbM family methyltransferase
VDRGEQRSSPLIPFGRDSQFDIVQKGNAEMFSSRHYFLAFPALTAIRLIGLRLKLRKSRRGELVQFPVSDRVCPALRAKTNDIEIFDQIFVLRDCEVNLRIEPRFIVDAGAHIGCSALFFASSFPRANIAAIEADPGNYQLLLRNTRAHRHIRAIHAAVWNKLEPVVIANEQDDPWGFQVKSADGQSTTIQGLTLSEVIRECGFEKIDLLKLDIEGAEKDIFGAGDLDWMTRTHAIIIELHDRFRPGCEAAFLDATRRFGFEITQRTPHNLVAQRTSVQ